MLYEQTDMRIEGIIIVLNTFFFETLLVFGIDVLFRGLMSI